MNCRTEGYTIRNYEGLKTRNYSTAKNARITRDWDVVYLGNSDTTVEYNGTEWVESGTFYGPQRYKIVRPNPRLRGNKHRPAPRRLYE